MMVQDGSIVARASSLPVSRALLPGTIGGCQSLRQVPRSPERNHGEKLCSPDGTSAQAPPESPSLRLLSAAAAGSEKSRLEARLDGDGQPPRIHGGEPWPAGVAREGGSRSARHPARHRRGRSPCRRCLGCSVICCGCCYCCCRRRRRLCKRLAASPARQSC